MTGGEFWSGGEIAPRTAICPLEAPAPDPPVRNGYNRRPTEVIMALAAGTRLGPYEIVAPAGAGGMGEVYRARDTRLNREVAIKVLPEHLSSNPEVRQRFEREAKTISQLSH